MVHAVMQLRSAGGSWLRGQARTLGHGRRKGVRPVGAAHVDSGPSKGGGAPQGRRFWDMNIRGLHGLTSLLSPMKEVAPGMQGEQGGGGEDFSFISRGYENTKHGARNNLMHLPEALLQVTRWPLHDKIEQAGPSYINLSRKVRHALQQIDRVLDLFEPGQLGLAFNGGKDSTVVMHLVKAACDMHPTHQFTHVQPIWFQHDGKEFPEVLEFMHKTADEYFTYRAGLKAANDKPLNRLWTIRTNTQQEFNEAMAQLAMTTGIRALLISSRRTDAGCRDLSQMALLDLDPVFQSQTVTRIVDNNKQCLPRANSQIRGLPLGISHSNVNQPSILRFSPILEWSYRDVWDFIIATQIPYCTLYDKGYTTIGLVGSTNVNPRLLKSKASVSKIEPENNKGSVPPLPLADIVGPELSGKLSQAIASLFKSMGVAVYTTECVKQRHKQEDPESIYWPAWTLKDESEENATAATPVLGAVASPFRPGGSAADDTAAILLVGAKDVNSSSFLSSSLREAGVKVRQVLVVENDCEIVAFMIRRLSPVHKYLFVVGGTGAGYGDVAIAAVAKALGTGVYEEPWLIRMIASSVSRDILTEYHLRMGYVPFGSELIELSESEGDMDRDWKSVMRRYPVVKKNNVFVLPSKPSLIKSSFEALRPLIKSNRFHVTRIDLGVCKARVSGLLAEASESYGETISFEQTTGADIDSTVVHVEGRDPSEVGKAIRFIVERLDQGVVRSVEDVGSGAFRWDNDVRQREVRDHPNSK